MELQLLPLPIARPPWKGLGRRLESLCRRAIFEFDLLNGVERLAIALSGGKDSLSLLFLLHAMRGRGLPLFDLCAIHVAGAFSCGAQLQEQTLQAICAELGVPLLSCSSSQKQESLECYSCSRERRRLIFHKAKEWGATTIAFGHHRDDSIQTLLMNLFHKGEFAATLPKVAMKHYGVTLIRPLIYVSEEELRDFAACYGFGRIVCQCPVGQNSMRKQTERMLRHWESAFPNARQNLSYASIQYGSTKALFASSDRVSATRGVPGAAPAAEAIAGRPLAEAVGAADGCSAAGRKLAQDANRASNKAPFASSDRVSATRGAPGAAPAAEAIAGRPLAEAAGAADGCSATGRKLAQDANGASNKAPFASSDRVSATRGAPGAAPAAEAIAGRPLAEAAGAADGCSAAGRKLTQDANEASNKATEP